MEDRSGPGQDRAGAKATKRRAPSMDELADLSDEELAELPGPPPSVLRRLPWWAYVCFLVFVLVVALVIWGEVNSQRYFLVCQGGAAEAHQGRGFPWPFGHRPLGGPLYRPVPLHVEAQCEPQELDSEDKLQSGLINLLVVELERKKTVAKLSDLDRARPLVTQGFALARGDKAWVKRLKAIQAQLDFQEGIFRLRDLEAPLLEARRLLDRVRKTRGAIPKSAIEDPEPWIGLVDHLLERLKAGSAPRREEVLPVPAPVPSRDATGLAPSPPLPPVGPTGPRRVSSPEEAPRPAIPILPDAGVRGGGILL